MGPCERRPATDTFYPDGTHVDHTAPVGQVPDLPSTEPAVHKQMPRNAPCPCGSGAKYKRCCGKDAPPVLNRAA